MTEAQFDQADENQANDGAGYDGADYDRSRRAAEVGGALLRYRVMAFATGVVLLCGTVALILKAVGVKHMEPGTGWLWVAHGYLYLVYLISTVLLGFKLRWPFLRYVFVALAGTIPTMSFVAEHFVTAKVRADQAALTPAAVPD